MQVALVVNPFATRVTEERLELVRQELAHVAELDVVLTERPGHATELVTEAGRSGVDAIVVFSGDGGFNEALNGLEPDMPIGFLPGGGTSVLPRALGISRDPVLAAKQTSDALAAGRTRRITVGRVNGRRFGFSSGIGLPAEVVRRVDAQGRGGDGKRPGDLSFAAAVVSALAADGGRIESRLEIAGFGRAAVAFVANGRPYTYVGNLPLPIAPEADFEHGIDLVAPEHVERAALVPTVVRVLAGRARGAQYGHDLDRIEIRCDVPLPLHVDGEDVGDVEHAVFEAERAAVSVLV